MIIHVQFIDTVESKNIIHTWCLFMVPDAVTLVETFDGIYSVKYSYGRRLDFDLYDSRGVMSSIATSKKVPSNSSDLMPAPLSMRLHNLKDNDSSLSIQFELQQKKNNKCVPGDSIAMDERNETVEPNEEEEHIDTITIFLMNRQNSYVNPKPNTRHRDNQQFNIFVALAKEKKWGDRPTSLDDFTKCLQLFSELLWEVDPHYEKIKTCVGRFPAIVVEKNLMGFNEPKRHRHTVKPMDISSLISKVTKLTIYLERKYMFSSHMKLIVDIISSVCKCICKYNDYLQVQRIRALKNH